MDTRSGSSEEWSALLSLLPSDIDKTVRECGALKRRREVRDAGTLMLLAMSYAEVGRSLRQTAAWAEASGLARMSDVALLKRLRSASAWFGLVLSQLLQRRMVDRPAVPGMRRVRLVDATTLSRRRSTGTDWRIHMTYDLGEGRIATMQVTDDHGGETFCAHEVSPGDVLVGDRGYAHRRGIHHVVSGGGHVVVRLNMSNVPLEDEAGVPIDLLSVVKGLRIGETVDVPVRTVSGGKSGVPSVAGRLIAIKKSPAVSMRERGRVQAEARKKKRTVRPSSLLSTHYLFVFTTLPATDAPAAMVLDIYRFRWQIEMAFKRLKGILEVDEIPARDEGLCLTFIYTKLIVAVLVEELAQASEAFSPWGYGTAADAFSMAPALGRLPPRVRRHLLRPAHFDIPPEPVAILPETRQPAPVTH